jgi:hypothetical protein
MWNLIKKQTVKKQTVKKQMHTKLRLLFNKGLLMILPGFYSKLFLKLFFDYKLFLKVWFALNTSSDNNFFIYNSTFFILSNLLSDLLFSNFIFAPII